MRKFKMKTKEYVELVHLDPRTLFNRRFREISERVSELDRTIGVHHLSGDLNKNFPPVSKCTPIRLGGAFWEECIHRRAKELRREGYRKVMPDRSISVSFVEYFAY
jgi:hypothetical protein